MNDAQARRQFNADEKGQISVLLLVGLIPIVFLIALVYNTAHQSIRKIELQGAADASAVSGGVWMARGMNLTVLNNNGMAEVLSVMIVVRALHYTIRDMNLIVIPPLIPVAAVVPAVAVYIKALRLLERVFAFVDNVLSNTGTGIGWLIMKALDGLNQVIKSVTPFIVQLQAVNYAHQNGADKPSLIISGARGASLTDLLPIMPVGRGGTKFIVDRAEKCQLPKVSDAAEYVLLVYAKAPLATLIFKALVRQNVLALKNSGVGGIVQFLHPPLRWRNNPPRPMLLTDRPLRSPSAQTSIPEQNADLKRVRRFLQLLMVTSKTRKLASPIGGNRFPNETPVWLGEVQFTYAQADIYNPTYWDMFTQDWRAKLAKASLFDEKKDALARRLGLSGINQYIDWAFINTH